MSKYASLKVMHREVSAIANQSGWSFDTQTMTITHTVSCQTSWDAYCLAHPEARKYMNMKISYWEDLQTLFLGKSATGQFASTGDEINDGGKQKQNFLIFLYYHNYTTKNGNRNDCH
jgi:hypothetical protein